MQPYYQDEFATIYHGDCREVLPMLVPVDLVLTDPPYGIRYSPSQNTAKAWGLKTFTGSVVVAGDDRPFDPSVVLDFPRVILFGANHYADRLPPSAHWIVWDKRDGMPSNDFADCEMAWTNFPGTARIYRHLWNGAFRASERGEPRVHPTQKPLVLFKWIVENYSQPGDVILDPFVGSGTTLVAAKALGRRAIGIEIEERYCEIAATRLYQGVLDLQMS